jgi:hypothetical protein
MTSFLLAGVFAMLGILRDQRRWLAVLVAIISVGFFLLMLLWNGLA